MKRVYAAPTGSDGARFLVDQLWPRGLKKEAVQVQAWLKDVAPSSDLRRWFGHEPARWKEFQRRYAAELAHKPETWQPLLEAARAGDITLVFSARDPAHNNAVVLKSFLEQRLKRRAPRRPRSLAAA